MSGCAEPPEKAESNNPYFIPVNPDKIKNILILTIKNKTDEELADELYFETLIEKLKNSHYNIVDTKETADIILDITITRFYSSPRDNYDPISTINPVTALGDALIAKPVGEVVCDYRVITSFGKEIWAGSIAKEEEIMPGTGNEYSALKKSVEATVEEFIRRLQNKKK